MTDIEETLRKIDTEGKAKKSNALLIALGSLALLGLLIYQTFMSGSISKKDEEKYKTGAVNIAPASKSLPPETEEPEETTEIKESGKIVIDQALLDEINKKFAEVQQLREILAKLEAERKRLEQLQKNEAAAALQKRRDATPSLFTNKVKAKKPEDENNKEINKKGNSLIVATGEAKKMEDLSLTLLQGTKIPGVLEVAIDSELPGLLTAVTSADVYSAAGDRLLIPKRSKIYGESTQTSKVGDTRVFIVWNRIVTPEGLSINIDSPNADQIGRSGQGGILDQHFWKRFGAALLVSMIDNAFETMNDSNSENNINIETGENQSLATEMLKHSINIPPTVYIHNGTKINIIANKDIDFKNVLN